MLRSSVILNSGVILVSGLLATMPLTVQASEWPNGQTTIVVPYTPGNITDIAARVVAQKLADRSGQAVIVENRAGGSTQIGTGAVARAPADGKTLLLTGAVFATNPSLFGKLPYDSEKDLAPVGLVVSNPLVLVTATAKPYADFAAALTFSKQNPGRFSVASGGNGTLSHMAMALTAIATNTDMLHVPYRGGAAAVTDLLSGEVDAMWDNPSSAIPHISGGRTRALAVSGLKRNPALPNVPTMSELGFGDFEVVNWFGMFAPGKTDPKLLDIMHREIQTVLELPDVKERFAKEGVATGGPARAGYAAFVASETKKWGVIIREKSIKPD
jgi:tripartite-type tricarboxylate transporter receptor subunit TctC